MEYEVKIFNCEWSDIPRSENPAYRKTIYYDPNKPPQEWRCIIICKVNQHQSVAVGNEGYIVLDVSDNVPDVLHLGIFWSLDHAKMFTDQYVKKDTPVEVAKRFFNEEL